MPLSSQFLIVGPVEESSKFLVLIFLTGIMKSIKEPRDGILQAAVFHGTYNPLIHDGRTPNPWLKA
ncbi:MAG: PrsW family intramembrane metalloprotease [Spirochaetales bacterium]|nr:PrsW family intramembrane metalloprotease [Spirochaetales bacterium]